jgi:hypothetical protein
MAAASRCCLAELEWDLPGLNTLPSRKNPALFFCPQFARSIFVLACPLEPQKPKNTAIAVVGALRLQSFDQRIPMVKPDVPRGIFAENVGDQIRQLESRPDIGHPHEGVGNEPMILLDSGKVVVDGDADVLLRAKTLIKII